MEQITCDTETESDISIENLLIQNLSSLKKLALKFTRNNEDAEDLVNDVCLKVLTNKDKLSNNKNIKGWFNVMLRNIFINNWRRDKSHNIISDELNEGIAYHEQNNQELLYNISPESSIICEEIYEHFDKKYLGYNEYIAYLNGYTYQQIADIFEINLGTCKSRIFKYRHYIMDKLRNYR